MLREHSTWLPHVAKEVIASVPGSNICMYSIALEGWRRGLTLKVYQNKANEIGYLLASEKSVHHFNRSRGDLVTEEAVNICKNKHLTKEYLSKAGVPVPEGKIYRPDTHIEDILSYARLLKFPVVLKPTSGSMGKGVISNIQDEKSLKEALLYIRQEAKYNDFIVEKYVPGEDYRVYVLGGQAIAAIKRIPANIIGDGVNTIRDLISIKNKERKKNPFMAKAPIAIDGEVLQFISRAGYTPNSILPKDEILYLRAKCNASAGGDSIDTTDILSSKIKKIAVDAANAIPGLVQSGVDIMVQNDSGAVIEVNSRPEVGIHLYPTHGQARDIPKAIVDYYFPETKSKKGNIQSKTIYFNLKSILPLLKNGAVQEVKIPSAPQEKSYSKEFVVSGDIWSDRYKRWIKKKALSLKLNGFAKRLRNGNIQIVVGGNKDKVEALKKVIYACKLNNDKIEEVNEQEWKKPVRSGFLTLEEKNKSEYIKKIESELRKVKNENNLLKAELKKEKKVKEKVLKDRNNFKKKYYMVLTSRTWRYTKPIRSMSAFWSKNRRR